MRTNSAIAMRLLLFTSALLALSGTAHALACLDGECPGENDCCIFTNMCGPDGNPCNCNYIAPDTGTCSGPHAFCPSDEWCCDEVAGCKTHEAYPGDFICIPVMFPVQLHCTDFDNDKQSCINAGCTWTPGAPPPECVLETGYCGGSSIPIGLPCCPGEGECLFDDGVGEFICGTPAPNQPPNKPLTPVIASTLTPGAPRNTQITCTQNCPPSPATIDPDNPTVPVAMGYTWFYRKTTGSRAPVGTQWVPAPGSFSCIANPTICAIGNRISLQSRATDNDGASTLSEYSSEVTITCSQQGQYCSADSDCCGAAFCSSGSCQPQTGQTVTGQINLLYIIYALIAAIASLALAYMASYAFSMPSLRAVINDELVQVIATGMIAFLLIGLQVELVDNHLSGILTATGDTSGNSMLEVANSRLDDLATGVGGVMEGMLSAGNTLGQEASKSVFCNFLGVGFSIANCSQLNAFRGSLTLGTVSSGLALADVFAQKYLLSMAQNFAFTLLIPLGLFMRCFKVGRGAGGALIAVGFGFYAVYPTVIAASENMLHTTAPVLQSVPALPGECDPAETDLDVSLEKFNDYSATLTNFDTNESIVYYVLVRTVFMSIFNLIITLGFIRAFAHILGSEIDVSSLARIS